MSSIAKSSEGVQPFLSQSSVAAPANRSDEKIDIDPISPPIGASNAKQREQQGRQLSAATAATHVDPFGSSLSHPVTPVEGAVSNQSSMGYSSNGSSFITDEATKTSSARRLTAAFSGQSLPPASAELAAAANSVPMPIPNIRRVSTIADSPAESLNDHGSSFGSVHRLNSAMKNAGLHGADSGVVLNASFGANGVELSNLSFDSGLHGGYQTDDSAGGHGTPVLSSQPSAVHEPSSSPAAAKASKETTPTSGSPSARTPLHASVLDIAEETTTVLNNSMFARARSNTLASNASFALSNVNSDSEVLRQERSGSFDGTNESFARRARASTIAGQNPGPSSAKSPSPALSFNDSFTASPTVRTSTHLMKQKLGDGRKIINDYIVYQMEELGRGSYSKVKVCLRQSDEKYFAMKVMDKTKLAKMGLGYASGLKKAGREIAILKELRHQHVIALEEVIDDPTSYKLYLVLELAGFGPLMTLQSDGTVSKDDFGNNTIPEEEAKRIIRCVVSALKYVHGNGIAHRDIKPENILLTDDDTPDVKLSDFGVSAIIEAGDKSAEASCQREGSMPFLSPEMLQMGDTSADLFKADVWALGVTAYIILHGRVPWYTRSEDPAAMLDLINETPVPEMRTKQEGNIPPLSENVQSFLKECLIFDPDERPDMEELACHPWLEDPNCVPKTPAQRPSLTVSKDDEKFAITIGELRDLTMSELRAEAPRKMPSLVAQRRSFDYATMTMHFAMSDSHLKQSFDDSAVGHLPKPTALQDATKTPINEVLACHSPYGRARNIVSAERSRRSASANTRASVSPAMPASDTPDLISRAATQVVFESSASSPNFNLRSAVVGMSPLESPKPPTPGQPTATDPMALPGKFVLESQDSPMPTSTSPGRFGPGGFPAALALAPTGSPGPWGGKSE